MSSERPKGLAQGPLSGDTFLTGTLVGIAMGTMEEDDCVPDTQGQVPEHGSVGQWGGSWRWHLNPQGPCRGAKAKGASASSLGGQGREKRQPQPGRLLACLSKGKADLSPDSAGTTPPLSPDSVLPAGSAGNECLRSSIVRVKVSCFKNNQICMPQGVSVCECVCNV